MLDLLKSKGVQVNEDRGGYKIDSDHEFLKYWMVRTREDGDDFYMFCCGFDMLNDGKLVISHREYPVDEDIFESLMDAIVRNEGHEHEPEDILLMPDLDYYDIMGAEREE